MKSYMLKIKPVLKWRMVSIAQTFHGTIIKRYETQCISNSSYMDHHYMIKKEFFYFELKVNNHINKKITKIGKFKTLKKAKVMAELKHEEICLY